MLVKLKEIFIIIILGSFENITNDNGTDCPQLNIVTRDGNTGDEVEMFQKHVTIIHRNKGLSSPACVCR